jgi:hypothetical protein
MAAFLIAMLFLIPEMFTGLLALFTNLAGGIFGGAA